ncbi:hypothetical protein M514_06134 [Trichuris suis]|uniref:Prolyl 4-hydroxylase alpha subunit domain-containing protein n=1 Tax=Trichuris suis TaxID=68888 RepID=A0A085NK47_9BILA|nr:hypothetical protein M513_06134 [Trichuris suis]KFD69843.1 hypothetical protein M514_06134 [Trichuris suis]KHJ44811.1 hypothetical protein D918_05064 [Trichuris suis]
MDSCSSFQLFINKDVDNANFLEQWKSKDDIRTDRATRIRQPFHCCAVKDFICANDIDKFFTGLRNELMYIEFEQRRSDLFRFTQSKDFETYRTPFIEVIKKFFYGQVREWMSELTGIRLDEKVALSSSMYGPGDYLLCHDDQLEGRVIAFVLYLTEGWTAEDGGRLDIFTCDDCLKPTDIAYSFIPEVNTLAFFEVAPNSFHQVSEVTCDDKLRLSVHGWYFGDPIVYPARIPSPIPSLRTPYSSVDESLRTFINPQYFEEERQTLIQSIFEAKSEIELQCFLKEEIYNKVCAELSSLSDKEWLPCGPWNKRHYFRLSKFSSTPTLEAVLKSLSSKAMLHFLASITGIEFNINGSYTSCAESAKSNATSSENATGSVDSALDERSNSQSSPERKKARSDEATCNGSTYCCSVRKFCPGCYTLLYDSGDNASCLPEMQLDAVLYFVSADWKNEYGGTTAWLVDSDDESEVSETEDNVSDGDERSLIAGPDAVILSIPGQNTLTLVYHEREVRSYIEYISQNATANIGQSTFYDMHFTYFE